MTSDHIAVCREDGCDERETFPTQRAIRASEWTDISPYGISAGMNVEHEATCPRHTGEDVDDESDEDDDSGDDDVYESYGSHMGSGRYCGNGNVSLE